MITITLEFHRRPAQYSAFAQYPVGKKGRIRYATAHDRERAGAIARCLSILRKRGHGGKPYTVLPDQDGDNRIAGVVPMPRPRPKRPCTTGGD